MTEHDEPAPPAPVIEPSEDAVTAPAHPSWFREAVRVLTFRAPRWEGLRGSPALIALLTLVLILFGVGAQRPFMDGPLKFYWTALLNGWAATVICTWLWWIVSRSREHRSMPPIDTGTLMTLLSAAALVSGVVDTGLGMLLLATIGPGEAWPPSLRWVMWLLPMVWLGLASLAVLWRVAGSLSVKLLGVVLMPVAFAISGWLQPQIYWWPDAGETSEDTSDFRHLELTDQVLAAQAQFMTGSVGSLSPPVPDRVNLYALTYAPHATENVFMRESAVVAKTMADRFGASGRTVQLVINPDTATSLPWATPPNLRRALAQIGAAMDRDRDVLFIHLTSHGGRDGKLAVSAWPLQSESVTPDELKQWMDEAGIRWRVVSVSACYSGSWIEPLADENTLVMTAADAEHTSYGCGKRSTLTFFGRAMYEEALNEGWSFRVAHEKARRVIEGREKEAGKTDGFSNPQIREGQAIAAVLDKLERQQRLLGGAPGAP